MENTQQTSRKQMMPSSIDRLSAFPDEVLCHILSFLPTKTSASTSILAQRWRFLWTHVPNLIFGHDRGKTPEIETIYNKVMLLYSVNNMNALRVLSGDNDTESCRSQIVACIHDAINRNVKEIDLLFHIAYTFPSFIFNCKTLVSLRLAGYSDLSLMTGDVDVWLPSLKKLLLDSVEYECEKTLSYLLSCCPVLEELTVYRSYPDVDCFIISSRTINRLVIDSSFYGHFSVYNWYTMKIDAPELRYLKVNDYASKDIKSCPLTSLVEADVNFNGDADDDDEYHIDASVEDDVDDDYDSVEGDANNFFNGEEFVIDDVSDNDDDDALVEGDVNDFPDDDNDFPDDNALNNEAPPVEKDVLYARSVLEFVGGLCNVKYLRLATNWMNVSDSEFSAWAAKFTNLIKLEFGGDWRFLPNFLQTANNLQVLRLFTGNKSYKHWIDPDDVPTCLLTHLRVVRFDYFEAAKPEMNLIMYILRNAKVLKRMEIHSIDYGLDLEKKNEAFILISLFNRGSVGCTLDFH